MRKDGRPDRHDEANSRISQFCRRVLLNGNQALVGESSCLGEVIKESSV